ncbi:J domain-containing protein [Brumimicrobium mesophilum]|uniref:J domain-containing protein n=1 Tax=Brumimicrobium mesophilum TaxID=392717 RepID=UPI000D13F31B|nr:DnaJ domain-containing protein [Brumimicrobium mesophilum]
MSTKRYFQILGISPTKDEKIIKKAYRKKAMKYHPDRNPSGAAKDKFIEITEAYERLLEIITYSSNKQNTSQSQSTSRQTYNRQNQSQGRRNTEHNNSQRTSRTSTREERAKQAQQRYEHMKRKEALENDRYFQKITTGKKWKQFKIIMYTCTIFALLFTLDQFVLPTKTIGSYIVEKNTRINYAGAHYETTSPVIFNNGQKAWISLDIIAMEETNYMFLERTFFFKDIKYVKVWRNNNWYQYTPDYSLISTFPLVPMVLLLPLLAFFIKAKTFYFSLLFNISSYIMPIILILFLLSNDRWAHLLTLGLLG